MNFLTVMVLLVLSSGASAAAADIKGRWIYKYDECKTGVAPKDRWAGFAYKNINLFVYDKEFSSTAVFQTSDFSTTCSGGVSGIYELDGEKFIQTIKLINQGNLDKCGIQIPSSVDTPTVWIYEIRGNMLRQNKLASGENVCGKNGDLIEVYEKSSEN
jgi:hypothetical protein